MKRLLIMALAALLGGTLVAGANAQRPAHFRDSFSDSFVIPAGDLCDFDQRISFTLSFNDVVFGDLDDPDHVISHVRAFVSHTNLKTGYTLTEVDRTTERLDFVRTGSSKSRGSSGSCARRRASSSSRRWAGSPSRWRGMELRRTPHIQPHDVSPTCRPARRARRPGHSRPQPSSWVISTPIFLICRPV